MRNNMNNIKRKVPRQIILTALILLIHLPGTGQNESGSRYASSEDSINCGKHISAYRTFFRLKLYKDAYPTWLKAFTDCPVISEMMYVDGATMYRSFIEETPDGPVREGLIDTLILIYDRRMENFGGEGNILGRKGRALLSYRGADIRQVHEANGMLRRSAELEGTETQEAVLLYLIYTGIRLHKENRIDYDQVIRDYSLVIGILNQLEGRSSRWERTTATINDIMQKEGYLSCSKLNRHYKPLFEQNKDDITFLKDLLAVYNTSECQNADIYIAASENLYRVEPDPESAYNLGILFITTNDYEKAAGYLLEAVQGEDIDADTRAEWYYVLGVVSTANNNFCDAIAYAREAIRLKSDYGNAFILLGDAIIASRHNLGEDFQQRSAYWAAADNYDKAVSVDASVAAEANQKLNDCKSQFPSREDVFFHDIQEGDSYQVEGCINENTSVRSRE